MSDFILVKFKEEGKWADNPADPIFEVKAGEECEVSANFANMLAESGKGKIVKKKTTVKEPKEPKEGDPCVLENGKEGFIDKSGKCIKG